MFQFRFPHNIHRQFVGDLKTHKIYPVFSFRRHKTFAYARPICINLISQMQAQKVIRQIILN